MMQHDKDASYGFVVCVDNHDFPVALELHKIYHTLPDQDAAMDGDLRVIDESGEDYLFPAALFVAIDLPSEVEATLAGVA